MINGGKYDHRDKRNRHERLNDPLALFLLGARPPGCSPLQELRIISHEVDGDGQHRHEKYGQKSPRLPVIEGPGWKEQ